MVLPALGTAELTGRMSPDPSGNADALRGAAQAAMYAPSVHNSQP